MEVFGLDKEQWDVINGFANWLAALGTIAAVAVSLHLARSAQSIKAKVSVSDCVIVAGDGTAALPIILFETINLGTRSFEVVALGWKYGKGKSRRSTVQVFNWEASTPLPRRLQESDRGRWQFSPVQGVSWYKRMAEHFSQDWKSELATLKGFASLSTGEIIECVPAITIIEKLSAELLSRYG